MQSAQCTCIRPYLALITLACAAASHRHADNDGWLLPDMPERLCGGQEQHIPMIKSLLRHGRGLDLLRMPDKDGLLPLGLAVAWNYLSVATELLNFVKYDIWDACVGPRAARHLLLMSCRSQHTLAAPASPIAKPRRQLGTVRMLRSFVQVGMFACCTGL